MDDSISDGKGGAVAFYWPPPELSPNARSGTFHKGARAKAKYRADCYALTLAAGLPTPPEGPIPVRVHFVPPSRAGYDQDNLVARMKAGLDGLAQALRVDDNRFRLTYRYHPPASPGEVLVELVHVGEAIPDAPNRPTASKVPGAPRKRKTRKRGRISQAALNRLPERLRARVLDALERE